MATEEPLRDERQYIEDGARRRLLTVYYHEENQAARKSLVSRIPRDALEGWGALDWIFAPVDPVMRLSQLGCLAGKLKPCKDSEAVHYFQLRNDYAGTQLAREMASLRHVWWNVAIWLKLETAELFDTVIAMEALSRNAHCEPGSAIKNGSFRDLVQSRKTRCLPLEDALAREDYRLELISNAVLRAHDYIDTAIAAELVEPSTANGLRRLPAKSAIENVQRAVREYRAGEIARTYGLEKVAAQVKAKK